MSDDNIPVPEVNDPTPEAVQAPAGPPTVTITIDAATAALLLDGLALLPLHRSLGTFERLRAEYRRVFEGAPA